MNPEEKNALFMDALLGELSATQREQLDVLLSQDAAARDEFDELRALWRDLGIALETPADQDESPLALLVERLPQRRSTSSRRTTPALPSTPARRWWGVALAAGIALFLLGVWLGASRRSVDSAGGPTQHVVAGSQRPRFVVLLYAKPSTRAPDPEFMQKVVAEMTAWRDELAAEHRHILAEKLSGHADIELETVDGAIQQRSAAIDAVAPRLGGFYVIRANDLEEATEIARQCPLLQYDGIVRVRAIDDV